MNRYEYSTCPPPSFIYPNAIEGKLIRKVYSNTAFALIVSELFTVFFAEMLYGLVFIFGYQDSYDEYGNIIMAPAVVLYGYTSVTLALMITVLIFGSSFHLRLSDLFQTEKLSVKKIFLTAVIAVGVANAVYVIDELLGALFYMAGFEVAGGTADPVTSEGVIAEVIASVILAPIGEELFYRGIILRNLCKVSKSFGIIVSSVIFGLAHGNIYQLFLGIFVGIVFAYADLKMNSILPSVIAHAAVNGHTYIYSLAVFEGEWGLLINYAAMALFIAAGAAALVYVIKKYGIEFPEYTEYHRTRTFPLLVRSVPAWIFFLYSIFNVVTAFTPIH